MSKKQEQQTQKSKHTPTEKKAKKARNFMQYSGMAFQMGAIMAIGTFVGVKLDQKYQLEGPYLTVLFLILSFFAALYLTLKDLVKK